MKLQAPDGSVNLIDSHEIARVSFAAAPPGTLPTYATVHTKQVETFLVAWFQVQQVENQMAADIAALYGPAPHPATPPPPAP